MNNTPKTDAFLQEYYDNDMYFGEESTQDMAEFARGLERQLEEARYSATDYAMKLGRANEKLAEAREEALKYKIKYNNQSSDILRLRQSKKDQTELIRKLKEKGDE